MSGLGRQETSRKININDPAIQREVQNINFTDAEQQKQLGNSYLFPAVTSYKDGTLHSRENIKLLDIKTKVAESVELFFAPPLFVRV